jgi:hypothetical protein
LGEALDDKATGGLDLSGEADTEALQLRTAEYQSLLGVLDLALPDEQALPDLAQAVEAAEAALADHDAEREATQARIADFADVADAATGTVRLKKNIERADEMALDTASTRTTRIRG